MQQNGFQQLPSHGNAYLHKELFVRVLAYVYDRVAFGQEDDIKTVFSELYERFLLKDTGQLNHDADKTRFLGRNLERIGDTTYVSGEEEYYENVLTEFCMESCREAPAPAASSPSSSSPRG